MGPVVLLVGAVLQASGTGGDESLWEKLAPVLTGAVIALVAAGLVEWLRFRHERALRLEERHAESQRATLKQVQEQAVFMVRAASAVLDADWDTTREQDPALRSEIAQLRHLRTMEHKDAEFRLDILRERLVNPDLRAMIE